MFYFKSLESEVTNVIILEYFHLVTFIHVWIQCLYI